MKVTAAVVNGEKRDFELEEIELDAPKDNEVLIKLVATGVCHTDVAGQDGLTTPMPVVLGHEMKAPESLNRWALPCHPLNRAPR